MADSEDDDLYGETLTEQKQSIKKDEEESSGDEPMDEGLESNDDDDDDSESDIEIIIDKPIIAPKPAAQHAPQESKAIKIEAPPQHSTSTPSHAPKAPTATGNVPQLSSVPGTAYPAQRTSTIDVNGNPVYTPAGKEILQVDMEADMAEEQKIWRKPGEDQSDYFNYGFDEFTWEMYRQRQVVMAQALQGQKNDVAQMQQMMQSMPGMPNMQGPGQSNVPAGVPSGPGGGGGAMGPGSMDEAQMEMIFQQMASQGIDPRQMDFNQFMEMAGQFPNQGSLGGQQHQGGGFQQGNQGGGGGGGRAGRGGRGRGW